MKNVKQIILNQLIYNKSYFQKVIPFIKTEYFDERQYNVLFEEIYNYAQKYKIAPDIDALKIEINKRTDVTEGIMSSVDEFLNGSKKSYKEYNEKWLIDETEKYCKKSAMYNAITEGISIFDGSDKKRTHDAIPDIMKKALAVSFDPSIGHDFFENSMDRFEFYHRTEEKLPFKVNLMNVITNGGLSKKTLNIFTAGTNAFKTGMMCDLAAFWVTQGKNVLYITMEMSEERIAERIDANLLKLEINDVHTLPEQTYSNRLEKLRTNFHGNLIIKEYPTAGANVNHFRGLLNELMLKKEFKADVIIVDYLNICSSANVRSGGAGMYELNKKIAEELRGLAVEFDVPLITANQFNRKGQNNSDPTLEEVGESHGVSATADFMLALISTEEMEREGRILIKQLKNRYGDKAVHKSFFVGVNKAKMTIYDVDDAEDGLADVSNVIEMKKPDINFGSNKFAN